MQYTLLAEHSNESGTLSEMKVANGVMSVVLWTIGVLHFLIAAVAVLLLLVVFPARTFFPLVQLVCRVQLRLMGCRLEIVNPEIAKTGSAFLLLGNHESVFDVFAIGAALPGFAIGLEADQHFRFPLWGWITRSWGNIPLPEGRINEARSALDRAAAVLRDGTHVVILPEGHRTRTGRLGPLKKGAFYLALATEADICPFVMQGLYEFKNTHSWRLHPRTLRVVFGQPIPWQSYAADSPAELMERVRHALEGLDA